MKFEPGQDFDGERNNWKIGDSEQGPLDIEEYLAGDEAFLYMESDIFEDLMGYNAQDLLERADSAYGTSFSSIDVEDYEYGDGWALFHIEE